ncbi:MAG: hypothetical protein L3K06_04635 [Thermoplasmata archaeon]|nr:hypothetical protein [Thermoplasmata archaeon]MCI4354632.1 hypothetical protein [Thermoplasmata archaeon]
MDGRIIAGFLTIALPAVLIGVTIWRFSSNPISILGLLAVLLIGGIYQLSYPESF